MVMKKLRESAKIMLIILVISFVGLIVFEWGMDVTGLSTQSNVMGEVNGQKIMADQYYQNIRNQVDLRRNQGGEISDQEMEIIENQIWDGMVQEILMGEEIVRRGITVSDSEVVSTIRNNPPELLRSNETFLTDGQFDMVKYQQALYDPRNDWLPIEQYVRSVLPIQKLQNQISAAIIITPEQLRWEYVKKNEKVNVKYIFFNPNDYLSADITIEESEIEAYYNENQDKYKDVEKRKIDYALIPIVPTEYDSQAVQSDAQDLLRRISDGADFASLAETYSEGPSAPNGGDLGFFGKGTMAKPFEDASFAANVGEVVGPVTTQFGLHLIKVEDKKFEDGEEKVSARHILLKYEPSNQTRGDLQTKATLLAMDAIELGYEEAMSMDTTITSTTSQFFTAGGFIPGIGFSKDVSQYVFSAEVGDVKEEPFETDQGFLVAKVSEIQNERIKPIEEVQSSIRNILQTEKRKEMSRKLAEEIRAKIITSDDFERVAAEDSLEIKTPTAFTRDETVPAVGKDPHFAGTAFSLMANEISLPVETLRGYYLIKLLSKMPVEEANFESQKSILQQQLLVQKQQQAFTNWYTALKEKADIKDQRPNRI